MQTNQPNCCSAHLCLFMYTSVTGIYICPECPLKKKIENFQLTMYFYVVLQCNVPLGMVWTGARATRGRGGLGWFTAEKVGVRRRNGSLSPILLQDFHKGTGAHRREGLGLHHFRQQKYLKIMMLHQSSSLKKVWFESGWGRIIHGGAKGHQGGWSVPFSVLLSYWRQRFTKSHP